jgi:hypothetical protein
MRSGPEWFNVKLSFTHTTFRTEYHVAHGRYVTPDTIAQHLPIVRAEIPETSRMISTPRNLCGAAAFEDSVFLHNAFYDTCWTIIEFKCASAPHTMEYK